MKYYYGVLVLLSIYFGFESVTKEDWGWVAFWVFLILFNLWSLDGAMRKDEAKKASGGSLPPVDQPEGRRVDLIKGGYEPVETPFEDVETAYQAHVRNCKICKPLREDDDAA